MINLCINAVVAQDSSSFSISSFISSVLVAILILGLTIWRENYKKNKQKREIIRFELYSLGEKILLYAECASSKSLAHYYYYALHKTNKDEDFDKLNSSKYLSEAESALLEMNILLADFNSKLKEFDLYWKNENEKREIQKLDSSPFAHLYKRSDIIFNKSMTEEQIQETNNRENALIKKYVREIGWGKNIIEIQKILYPQKKDII